MQKWGPFIFSLSCDDDTQRGVSNMLWISDLQWGTVGVGRTALVVSPVGCCLYGMWQGSGRGGPWTWTPGSPPPPGQTGRGWSPDWGRGWRGWSGSARGGPTPGGGSASSHRLPPSPPRRLISLTSGNGTFQNFKNKMHQLYPAGESPQDILEVRKTQEYHLSLPFF